MYPGVGVGCPEMPVAVAGRAGQSVCGCVCVCVCVCRGTVFMREREGKREKGPCTKTDHLCIQFPLM